MDGRAMNPPSFAGWPLRLRLLLAQASPIAIGAALLFLLCAAALAWLLHALAVLDRERAALKARLDRPAASAPAPALQPVAAPAVDTLAQFYAALGPRRYAEQQVGTLFALAAKNGLVLSQGEYKSAWDRNARVHTYQVNLPVKGSYAAIWQFALSALRTIPFASLDDISFRRDSIGDPVVEARLRLTLYLGDGGGR
jgi:hypothetical protein